ncbi:MAG: hypothetical protein V3U62_10330 [Sedimenticolaceae bacterium]
MAEHHDNPLQEKYGLACTGIGITRGIAIGQAHRLQRGRTEMPLGSSVAMKFPMKWIASARPPVAQSAN